MAEVALLALLTLLASGVGALSGFGTSTIMVPVVALYFPLPVTLLFVGIIHLFGDIWKMLLFRSGVNWWLILSFGVPGILLSFAGARLTVDVPGPLLERFLGAFLLAYVVFLFLHESWRLPRNRLSAVGGGALSGFFAGLFGVGGAIRWMFLSAFDLPKATYIFASGAIALVIDIVRLSTYLLQGTRLDEALFMGMLVFIPASLLGSFVAKRIVTRIPQAAFRKVVAAFLGLVALRFLFLSNL